MEEAEMPSDLIVSRILLPPTVSAPCPVDVDVEITNIGDEPAELPFDVALAFSNPDEPVRQGTLIRWVRSAEGRSIVPNQTVTVTFQVVFPCRPQVTLWVTADYSRRVLNNSRSDPQKTVLVQPDLVPWLQSSLRVGLYAQNGIQTWNSPALCPNADLFVEAVVRNTGCADPHGFYTELEMTTAQQSSFWGRFVPGIQAGGSVAIPFFINAPSDIGPITFRFRADTAGQIPNQCSTTGLSATINTVVQTGAAPTLAFSVNGPIFPGQLPTINWSIHNDCSDLRTVQAQVSFGPTKLYETTPIPIGLRASVSRDNEPLLPILIPSAVANQFWQFGAHNLMLSISVTGTAPTPAPIQATFRVDPEPAGVVTFAWFTPPAGASWRRPYPVAGRFSNNSRVSAMTIAGGTAMETEPSLALATTLGLSPSVFGTIAAATLGTAGTQMRTQSWEWMNAVNYANGPASITVSYDMSFTFRDAFGNIYPGPFSGTSSVVVRIPLTKRDDAHVSFGAMIAALSLAAMAAIFAITALTTPYPANLVPAIAAAIFAVAAVAALGISIWYRAKAYDPPLPDFDYTERIAFAPPELPPLHPEAANSPLIQSLHALQHLMQRIRQADEMMYRIHRKMIGAHTDGAEELLRLHAEDYEKHYRMLKRSASLFPDAISEFEQAFRSSGIVKEEDVIHVLREWKEKDVPDSARHAWKEADLSEDTLMRLSEAVRQIESMPGSVFDPLYQLAMTLSESLKARESENQDILNLNLGT
jgi:hypothetical protein